MKPNVTESIEFGPIRFKHPFESLMFGFAADVVMATRSLEACKAWPGNSSDFDLLIQSGSQCEVRFGQHAHGFSDESAPFAPSIREISIGSAFLSTPALASLIDRGADDHLALVHALGHETFHMTEVERQAACLVPYRSVKSGFARSVRPEMSQDWLDVCIACASYYRGHVRKIPDEPKSYIQTFSSEALAAHDAVSEGCADLIGMRVADAVFGSFRGLDVSLPQVRIAMGKNPAEYQSGAFIQSFLGGGQSLALDSVVKQSWEYARGKLLSASDCPDWIKDKLRVVQFTFGKPLPDLNLTRVNAHPPAKPARQTGKKIGL